MTSFDALGLSPELVEALAAEGIEVPTSLQHEAIPVLRKGHNALLRGGPGAGIHVAWSAPLLDRLEPTPGGPVIVALVATAELALDTARVLSRLASAAGHRVATFDGPYALPGHAEVLVTTPRRLQVAVASTEVSLAGTQALVMAGASAILADPAEARALEEVPALLEGEEIQHVVVADPITPEVRRFVDAHVSRAIFLPPDAGQASEGESAPVQRGSLRMRVLESDEGLELPRLVGELMDEGHRHLLLFFRSEDRAADLGDLLTLHGFGAGEPGDPELPVWLATDGLEARKAAGSADQVLHLSVDCPPDADELDRRHGSASDGVILSRSREAAHLRRITREAGYTLTPFPLPGDARSAARRMAGELEEVIEGQDLEPYHLLVEEAVDRWGASEVAAALAFLLRRKASATPSAGGRAAAGAGGEPARAAEPGVPAAFVRLFLSVGSRDGIGPGELLGAITGETGIKGDRIGRIDVRDTFSRIEVEEAVAADILKAMNGISIRGRSVRADYDRQAGRSTPPRGAPARGGDGRGGDGRGGPRGGGRPPRS